MLRLAILPSPPAADLDGQRSSVEAPPLAASKEVALIARTDGIRWQLHDRLCLSEIISEVRLNQLGHPFWALAGFPLIASPLAETHIGDNALQRANFSLEFRMGKHQSCNRDGVWSAVLCPGKIYVVRVHERLLPPPAPAESNQGGLAGRRVAVRRRAVLMISEGERPHPGLPHRHCRP